MTRAIFLDRDGVVNVDLGYVHKREDFYFTQGIFKFCQKSLMLGYLLIIVTNQAGIGMRYYTEDDFHNLNQWMLEEFLRNGIRITAVYYCPFHPLYGIGKYKRDSYDRKPNPGMIIQARNDYDINLSRSIMIGDKDSDIMAARKAGINRIIALKGKYNLKYADDVLVFNSILDIEAYITV